MKERKEREREGGGNKKCFKGDWIDRHSYMYNVDKAIYRWRASLLVKI